jgi:hypothetical protein
MYTHIQIYLAIYLPTQTHLATLKSYLQVRPVTRTQNNQNLSRTIFRKATNANKNRLESICHYTIMPSFTKTNQTPSCVRREKQYWVKIYNFVLVYIHLCDEIYGIKVLDSFAVL